jgi:hypothetical protein
MKNSKKQNPAPDRKGDEANKVNPSKPGHDPDQTPERETKAPPVAVPDKQSKPEKMSFADNFLMY